MKYDICVIGLGYIGLPTAAAFANAGKNVLGVDLDSQIVKSINRGYVHIVEKGLQQAIQNAIKNGTLRANTKMEHADAYILAVPTPIKKDRSADLSFVIEAATSIAPFLNDHNLVILESTSPPGTTEQTAKIIGNLRPDLINEDGSLKVLFSHAPERVLPGNALTEIVENDRILGGLTPEATERTAELYRSFVKGKILLTDATTAELVKLSENSFRDVNIAFANELSHVAEEIGVNVWEVIRLANHHPRVNIMQPGPGVGGHCIAVDPWFIVDAAPESAKLIKTARQVNDSKPASIISAIQDAIRVDGHRNPIVLLGLAFKKNIDDLRESPALNIALALAKKEPDSCFYIIEPNISKLPEAFDNIENAFLMKNMHTAIQSANIVSLLVDHDEFLKIDRTELKGKRLIDTRGLWS